MQVKYLYDNISCIYVIIFCYCLWLMSFYVMVNQFSGVCLACVRTGVAPELDPLGQMSVCSLTYVGAMLSSNASLAYVSYPAQVLAKSCKPIPGEMLLKYSLFVSKNQFLSSKM